MRFGKNLFLTIQNNNYNNNSHNHNNTKAQRMTGVKPTMIMGGIIFKLIGMFKEVKIKFSITVKQNNYKLIK